MTPRTLSKSASVHQKQPDAKVATVCPCPCGSASGVAAMAAAGAGLISRMPMKPPLSHTYPAARASATTRIQRCGCITRCPSGVGNEFHGDAVHAVPLARRFGTVGKDMTQMAAAAEAVHLRADHEKASINRGSDGVRERRPEAGPSGPAVVLRGRREKWLTASRTHECPLPSFVVQRAAVCALGPPLPEYAELLRGQPGTPLPVRLVHSKPVGVRTGAYGLRTAEPCCNGRKSKDRPDDSEELAPALHEVKGNPN